MMNTIVPDHPLIAHKLTVLRDHMTQPANFRSIVSELMTLLAYEATRAVPTQSVTVATPIAPYTGRKLASPVPIVVPILRAGLGMLDGMMALLPTAEVGFLGMERNDETLAITTYANRLPDDCGGRSCFILDPMVATGSTIIEAIKLLSARGARDLVCVSILAAQAGIDALEEWTAQAGVDFTMVTAAIDAQLNDHNYIVPGLGDAGDRMFGTIG